MEYKHVTRRRFLKTLSGGAALLALGPLAGAVRAKPIVYGPRVRVPNPFVTPEGKPILVCVKGTNFRQMLEAGLQEMGGLDRLIDSNQDVLIKPNLNMAEPYPGICTVENIVETLGVVKEATTGVVSVGDQGYHSATTVYNYLGLEEPVANAGGMLLYLSDTYQVRRDTWAPEKPSFLVYSDVYDAPIIISLHLLKRHSWAYLTCALKNNVGTIRGPSATSTRGYLHSHPPQSTEFLQEVAEIAGLVNPELSIVDARSILTRNGPSYYDGIVKDIHRIIICGDMVATDAYCARLMEQHDPRFSASMIQPTLQQAEELGLGTANLSNVEVRQVNLMRGDTNDDGETDISDVQYSINYLFRNGPAPFPAGAGDVNCDGSVDLPDVVYLINYLFKGGPPPC